MKIIQHSATMFKHTFCALHRTSINTVKLSYCWETEWHTLSAELSTVAQLYKKSHHKRPATGSDL